MTDSRAHDGKASLGGDLDRLAERAGGVLSRAWLTARTRQVLRRTVSVLCLFAVPGLLFECLRYLAGHASPGLRWWQHALLVLTFASVFAGGWLWRDYRSQRFARGVTLGLFDRQLGLANRLATADEFIAAPERSGFMAAAIDDAVGPAQRAKQSPLRPVAADGRWSLSRWSLLSVPVTIGLLLLTSWLSGLEAVPAPSTSLFADADDRSAVSVTAGTAEQLVADTSRENGREARGVNEIGADGSASATFEPEEPGAAGRRDGPFDAQTQAASAANGPSGGLPSGADRPSSASSAAARQSPAGGSRSGKNTASDSRQTEQRAGTAEGGRRPEETGTAGQSGQSGSNDSPGNAGASGDDRSSSTGETGAADAERERGERGTTNGGDERGNDEQGSGRSEDSSSDVLGDGGLARKDAATPGEEPGEGEGRGESPEQHADGKGGQPGVMERQAMGGRGEGDGGPANDPIKTNRGAATAMLALPMQDRVIGSRGRGPEHVRQEQSPAREEQAAPVAVDARTPRGDRIGTLQHARVSRWSRDLVQGYFDSQRAQPPDERTESTTDDPDQGEQR